jgi:membrane protease YdiL (CAAX protease family)
MRVTLKPGPIVRMLGLSAGVALLIILIEALARSSPGSRALMAAHPWLLADLVHIPQFLLPFLLILYITGGRPGTYGFNLRQDSHLTHRRILGFSVVFGLLICLKYIPEIIRTGSVDMGGPVTAVNVIGVLTFQWIVVGLCEETMFRGLIQTYLMKNLDGYMRLLGHDLHVGTVIGAVIWGGFHFLNILIMPLGTVVFFVILTTGIGLIMGYVYQRTGSLLTTIIMHNTILGMPVTVGYILSWAL